MTRRRMTWNERKASAPPATPGYLEGTNHPAYGQEDPDADQYMNGDPSSWAEDPTVGPYPNSAAPATPGYEGPQGHPATDPKHYFPAGAGKSASRNVRAAMEHKASKCIRIATRMLGRKASVDAVEDQALDLMNLSDRQIQAMLTRIAEEGPEANYTLTEPRTSGDLLADDLMIDDEDVIVPASDMYGSEELGSDMFGGFGGPEASDPEAESILAGMLAGGPEASDPEAESLLAGMIAGGPEASDPEAEAILAGMLAGGPEASDPEAEAILSNMVEGARLAARRRAAKKSEVEAESDAEADDEVKADDAEKKAAHFKRLASFWARKAGEKAEVEADGEVEAEELAELEAEEAKASAKKAFLRRRAGQNDPSTYQSAEEAKLAEMLAEESKKAGKNSEETAEDKALLAEIEAEEAKAGSGKKAFGESFLDDSFDSDLGDPMLEEELFVDDPMALMDDGGVSEDEMALLYGGKFAAKKSEEEETEEEETEEEETEEDEAEEPAAKTAAARTASARRTAALKPQPRLASSGVRTLGSVSKPSSNEVNDLSRLWESAPDVSKIFGN